MNDREKQKAFEESEKRITETISNIKNRIAVFSGKGGVGKTTISVNLAFAMQLEGYTTGILDADITGPNVAKMFGIEDRLAARDNVIVPFRKYGLKIISIAGILVPGQPVIWRGPMRSKMISQFLADVDWGELDFLIADLPPGTGDEILTIAQKMKPDYAVIVTTPQDVSIIDAERAINMAKELEIPAIGVIENMSGFVCPVCNSNIDLFGSGGGRTLADDCEVEFLGSIPIDIDARIMSDEGKSILHEKPASELANCLKRMAQKIEHNIQSGKINKEYVQT